MTVEQWMKDKNIANYGPHLEPIIRLAFEAGRTSKGGGRRFVGFYLDPMPSARSVFPNSFPENTPMSREALTGKSREIPPPVPTSDQILGTKVEANRCFYVDSIFGQCIKEPHLEGPHVMEEDL